MYVCMCVCACVHACVSVCMCMNESVVCVPACVRVCMYVSVSVCVCIAGPKGSGCLISGGNTRNFLWKGYGVR